MNIRMEEPEKPDTPNNPGELIEKFQEGPNLTINFSSSAVCFDGARHRCSLLSAW
jgi:hypothetical protein